MYILRSDSFHLELDLKVFESDREFENSFDQTCLAPFAKELYGKYGK